MTIASLMQQNYSQRDIAQLIGCSASTVSRELVRNAQGKTYDSQSAQRACQQRRIAASTPVAGWKMTPGEWA
jgi:transposase, IS30 family